MCNFLSVLVLRSGSIKHHPVLDSHSDLIEYFGLPDQMNYIHRFAKAELTPVDWTDPSTWRWRIDEASRPDWLDDVEGTAEKAARAVAARMVLREYRPLIADGAWIVPAGVTVGRLLGGRVIRLFGTVQEVYGGGTVQEVYGGGTVQRVYDGGTVQEVYGGTVQEVYSGGTVVHHIGGTVNGVAK